MSAPLPTGVPVAVDFNPVADRLRIVAANGLSVRVNVQDGTATVDGSLQYAPADRETALYDIDTATSALVKQAPPNDGVLRTVGSTGCDD